MYYEHRGDTHYQTFDSVTELVDTCRAMPAANREPWERCSLNSPSFVGRRFTDWNQAYSAALSDWPEGVAIVDRMIEELESSAVSLPRPKCRKRKLRFSEDDGDEIDLDRLRSGQAYWRKSVRENLTGPQTITIIADLGTSAFVNHEKILWRGAAAIALTHILEQAGYRVELWATSSGKHVYVNNEHQCLGLCLKRASDPLDSGTLIAAVSGWFLRSAIFSAMSLPSIPHQGLGQPRVPTAEQVAIVTGSSEYLLIAGAFSEEDAIEVARKALESIINPEPTAV